MSENPNPTRCGNCGTDNPPGQEFCITCGLPLTLAADAALLDEAPEAVDNPLPGMVEPGIEPGGAVIVGGVGGAPFLLPTDDREPH